MESELTAVEQPGAKCCFFMPNCFLKRHTMSRQADGTWAGTCVTDAPPDAPPRAIRGLPLCMRRAIAGGKVFAHVCLRVFGSVLAPEGLAGGQAGLQKDLHLGRQQ